MATGVIVPDDLWDSGEAASQAEELGYTYWSGELWGQDVFAALGRATATTEDVPLGTAIANVYSRSPATLAQAAATLDRAHDGPIRLGLGTSTPMAVENIHGLDFENPARQLHETTECVKQLLGDERVSYDGELVQTNGVPGLDADVAVYTAALGPAMRRATGRTADGWLPHNIPFPQLSEAFELIAETASEAGRDPENIDVAPYVPAAVSDDAEEARAALRGHVAYYVGSGEGYRRAVAQLFPDRADEISEAWGEGEREAAREAVTDEMIEALGVAGTPEDARDQLEAVAAIDVIDEPIVVIPDGADEDLAETTIRALAPAN